MYMLRTSLTTLVQLMYCNVHVKDITDNSGSIGVLYGIRVKYITENSGSRFFKSRKRQACLRTKVTFKNRRFYFDVQG